MKQLLFSCLISTGFLLSGVTANSQNEDRNYDFDNSYKNYFWRNVRFGGGLGLSFGDGFADVMVAPSAIYQFNNQFAVGTGLQFNYLKSKGYYESLSYGINVIGLYNPIPEIQLSAEVEQLRVNNTYDVYYTDIWRRDRMEDNFWNTAIFLGAGYSMNGLTVGVRYNILYDKDNFVYNQAWMPFIRFYF
ncbi:hypothetical protein QW060_18755 [Myroides ceti]|uniref:Alpha-ketoglutarate decarboxylase n=1 Tax=Paenimyroides ceti TaxID=395087 RepID=A0ABT8CX25_9FLAO|nr:hypothetical protein [Paenimyroides ceti]MDN3708158.1 hypothetical protein [Paenimyroides ceti]MDN3709099.1 hypothetical protein [Paenimyroides ceti]